MASLVRITHCGDPVTSNEARAVVSRVLESEAAVIRVGSDGRLWVVDSDNLAPALHELPESDGYNVQLLNRV